MAPVMSMAVSAAVWAVTAPLVAWRFHVIAPIGIPLNLILVPLAGLAVGSGGVSMLASTVWRPLGVPAGWVCGRLLEGMAAVVAWGDARTMGSAFVPDVPTGIVVGFYVMLGVAARASIVGWPGVIRHGAWLGVSGVALAGVVSTMMPTCPTSTEVEFLAVGHGLATVIQGVDGSASRTTAADRATRASAVGWWPRPWWARGVRRLETVVLSHADADHYNGLPDVLDRFTVGVVVVPEGFGLGDDPGSRALLDEIRGRGVRVVEARAGDRLPLVVGVEAVALHPPSDWLADAPDNDRSLVLDLTIGGCRVLLTGDLDGAGIPELIAGPRGEIDVLLAPHHGGKSANPPWLYDWARPRAVIASQRPPRFGIDRRSGRRGTPRHPGRPDLASRRRDDPSRDRR